MKLRGPHGPGISYLLSIMSQAWTRKPGDRSRVSFPRNLADVVAAALESLYFCTRYEQDIYRYRKSIIFIYISFGWRRSFNYIFIL